MYVSLMPASKTYLYNFFQKKNARKIACQNFSSAFSIQEMKFGSMWL